MSNAENVASALRKLQECAGVDDPHTFVRLFSPEAAALLAEMERLDEDGAPISQALQDVIDERSRHISAEGWTPEHDDEHTNGEMARAAVAYATPDGLRNFRLDGTPHLWPWAREWWKPKDRRRDLVRAASLIVAEIERLDRLPDSEARRFEWTGSGGLTR